MSSDIIQFFSDSSSHRGHKFVVVGGIAIRPDHVKNVNSQLQSMKEMAGINREFKWNEYKAGRKEVAYKDAVNLFFKLLSDNKLHFHCIICDFTNFDHKKDGPGNPEKSVNRLYYQLMLHRVCALYGQKMRILMTPDHGNDSAEIVNFRDAICAAAYQRYNAQPNCLRSIHPQPSAKHNILQMLDIIIGAIAAHREDRILGANKTDLRNHVINASPIKDFSCNTPRSYRKFTVWNFN